jgi:hypothetical protein
MELSGKLDDFNRFANEMAPVICAVKLDDNVLKQVAVLDSITSAIDKLNELYATGTKLFGDKFNSKKIGAFSRLFSSSAVKATSVLAEMKSLFAAFLHEADCRFRRYLKTGRYLQAKDAEAWAFPVIDAAAETDRKAMLEASRPKITIDLSGLDQIRKDALSTQNSLLTDEEIQAEPQPANTVPEPEEKSVAGENEPVSALPLDPVHIQILQRLLNGKSVQELIRQNHLLPAVIADTVNEVFYDEIGDTVLLCENDSLYLVDDYREDVEQLLKGGAG